MWGKPKPDPELLALFEESGRNVERAAIILRGPFLRSAFLALLISGVAVSSTTPQMTLYLVNALLLICTLGIAWPWVRVRNIHFAFRYLSLEGPLDLESIQQQAQFASATGEGLAGFLDTGFDLG